ncbi:DUF1214 domain-containing protein [Cyanobium sp. LEGE 06143]|nr:DUF1214 domain-containing protein [Cyanobium sp. LEGE 06143]
MPLDGGSTYAVTLRALIPAANSCCFMVYDNHPRPVLETDQLTGTLDSNSEALQLKPDGAATVYFGTKAPEDKPGDWIKTLPGKGYNVLLGLCGPEQAWFEKTWMPVDFEPVN